MTPRTNFDSIAGFYDRLSNLVFGDRIRRAQIHFLKNIPPGSAILIVGGGTGWIIGEIFSRTANCSVWFVESSREMLQRAGRYNKPGRSHFIQGTERSLPPQKFDVLVTNFYLDLFPDKDLDEALADITKTLRPGAIWLASDFVAAKWWHRLMLWLMYRFFRMVCSIEARSLPSWGDAILRRGYRPVADCFFYGSFIKSVLYARQPTP